MKRPKLSDALVGTDGGETISTTMGLSASDETLARDMRGGDLQSLFDVVGEGEEEVAGDGDDVCLQGGGSVALGEKKRRLSMDQVKALEKNFEVENKLEPERKVKLALELGLQPRQVAVWFQNRRARWKTKQLERDYIVLKADYDALRLNHNNLKHEHDGLLAEIKELKAKVAAETYVSIKEEPSALPSEDPQKKKKKEMTPDAYALIEEKEGKDGSLPALIYKDGSSDSDTSVILNDDASGAISSSSAIMSHHHQLKQQMMFVGFDHCSSPSSNFDGRVSGGPSCAYYPRQGEELDMEETGFLHGSSSFFHDEQAPTLYWNCSDQWGSDVRLDI